MFYKDSAEGHCKIYLTRPDVCRKHPQEPRDTAKIDECGYRFVNEKGEKVDMYMQPETRAHLNVAVARRRLLFPSSSRRGK